MRNVRVKFDGCDPDGARATALGRRERIFRLSSIRLRSRRFLVDTAAVKLVKFRAARGNWKFQRDGILRLRRITYRGSRKRGSAVTHRPTTTSRESVANDGACWGECLQVQRIGTSPQRQSHGYSSAHRPATPIALGTRLISACAFLVVELMHADSRRFHGPVLFKKKHNVQI